MFNKKLQLSPQELTSKALQMDANYLNGVRLKEFSALNWANEMRELLKKDPDEATRLIAFVAATAKNYGDLKKMADILAGPNLQAVLSGRSPVRADPALERPIA